MKGSIKLYRSVDLGKLIAALLVVLIHAYDGQAYTATMLVFSLCRLAVPFFFITSGFFFHKGLENAVEKDAFVCKYVKKQLLLYFLWVLVVLLPCINNYIHIYKGQSGLFIVLVLLRRILLGGMGAYWYILNLAESAIVIYFLEKNKRHKWLYLAIGIGLVLGFEYDNRFIIPLFNNQICIQMNKAFYTIFSWSNNFIMKGVPFMGIGYIIYEKRDAIVHFGKSLYIAICCFLLATGINFYFYISDSRVELFFIVQAVAFFIICITYEMSFSTAVSIRFRELSSCIYFMHTFFIYYVLDRLFGVYWNIALKYFSAVFLSCMTYFLIKAILKKHDIPLIRFMFNISSQA